MSATEAVNNIEGEEEKDTIPIDQMREAFEANPGLKRENAMLRALGPEIMDSTLGGIFNDHYSGDLTTDAIKDSFGEMKEELAKSLGIPSESTAGDTEQQQLENQTGEANQMRDDVSSQTTGAGETGAPNQDMELVGMAEFRRQMSEEGKLREEASQAGWAGIFQQQGVKRRS